MRGDDRRLLTSTAIAINPGFSAQHSHSLSIAGSQFLPTSLLPPARVIVDCRPESKRTAKGDCPRPCLRKIREVSIQKQLTVTQTATYTNTEMTASFGISKSHLTDSLSCSSQAPPRRSYLIEAFQRYEHMKQNSNIVTVG